MKTTPLVRWGRLSTEMIGFFSFDVKIKYGKPVPEQERCNVDLSGKHSSYIKDKDRWFLFFHIIRFRMQISSCYLLVTITIISKGYPLFRGGREIESSKSKIESKQRLLPSCFQF